MSNRHEDEDGVEELEGHDLKKAMQRLGRGPMRFAFGCKDGKPVLLMHATKSAKALSQKLRSELGATKTTHGMVSADGKAIVLDVEGPPVGGMGRMVKTLLREESIGKYSHARVRIEGEYVDNGDEDEEYDDSADEAGGDDSALDALREIRSRIQALEKGLAAILPRLGEGRDEDRAHVLDYCRNSVELYRSTQSCADPELAAYGKACSGRARKVAEYLKSSQHKGCAPATSLGGSVGKGGGNARADVALVQSLLARKGYKIAADGSYGPATLAAIVAYQRANLGHADGLIEPGRSTWLALTGQAYAKPGYGAQHGGGYGGQKPGYGGQKPGPGYGGATPGPGYGGQEPYPAYGGQRGYGGTGDEYLPRVEEEVGPRRHGEDSPHHGTEETEVPEAVEIAGTAFSEKTAFGDVDVLTGKLAVGSDGLSASGALARGSGELDLGDGVFLKGDAAVGSVSADAAMNAEGLAVGAQANLGEASATFGTRGTGDQDESVRLGVSRGVGLAGRVHWDDADKDGNPEYGVGADVGALAFDVKTEDPLRTAFQNSAGPLTQGAAELYDGNMTNAVGREVGGVVDAASQFFSGEEA
jgi:peptidoglycan hydrolase-like protein with peptidoglycan-binding domain